MNPQDLEDYFADTYLETSFSGYASNYSSDIFYDIVQMINYESEMKLVPDNHIEAFSQVFLFQDNWREGMTIWKKIFVFTKDFSRVTHQDHTGNSYEVVPLDASACYICGICLPRRQMELDHIHPQNGGLFSAVRKGLRFMLNGADGYFAEKIYGRIYNYTVNLNPPPRLRPGPPESLFQKRRSLQQTRPAFHNRTLPLRNLNEHRSHERNFSLPNSDPNRINFEYIDDLTWKIMKKKDATIFMNTILNIRPCCPSCNHHKADLLRHH